eukprot:12298921-Heterocapsa_arctica.AAC.1
MDENFPGAIEVKMNGRGRGEAAGSWKFDELRAMFGDAAPSRKFDELRAIFGEVADPPRLLLRNVFAQNRPSA